MNFKKDSLTYQYTNSIDYNCWCSAERYCRTHGSKCLLLPDHFQ